MLTACLNALVFAVMMSYRNLLKFNNVSIRRLTVDSNLKGRAAPRSINLAGVFPPLTTPFDSNGTLALDKLASNLQRWSQIEFSGYVLLGSNGEFPLLSRQEKFDLVKTVRAAIPPGKLLLVGAGCEGTRETVEYCDSYAKLGADAVLIVTPSFYKGRMTNSALKTHFHKVADDSPLPIVLYNVPANTGVDMDVSLVLALADHPNIIGLKDSAGNIPSFYRIHEETRSKNFQLLAGSAGFLLPALQAGCVGTICALANVLGEECVKLYQLFLEGKLKEARQLQARIITPNLLVTRKYGVSALKYTMDRKGYYGGPVRLPLVPLTASEANEVEEQFRICKFL